MNTINIINKSQVIKTLKIRVIPASISLARSFMMTSVTLKDSLTCLIKKRNLGTKTT